MSAGGRAPLLNFSKFYIPVLYMHIQKKLQGLHEVTDTRKSDVTSSVAQTPEQGSDSKGCLYQISRQNKRSIWLLAYVANLQITM